jgi:hypothetical protein
MSDLNATPRSDALISVDDFGVEHIYDIDAVRLLERQLNAAAEALKRLDRAYVRTLENGRDRIRMLGGDCDPVDVMERGDPDLREAREALRQLEDEK